jgi:hypothetical protein
MHSDEGHNEGSVGSFSAKAGIAIAVAFGLAAIYFGIVMLTGRCW